MRTLIIFLSVFVIFSNSVKADHITGGEMSYIFAGFSNGVYHYRVTLKLFMRCNSGRQFNNPMIIGVFDKATNTRIKDIEVSLGGSDLLNLTDFSPCITNPPKVCFEVGYYNAEIALPASTSGYILSAQVVFRIEGISNLIKNYSNIGATYTSEIPGTARVSDDPQNNSAQFTGDDMVVVCSNNSFSYNFGASDKDGDRLRFSFCNALQGGVGGFGNNSNPPATPPYASVPYSSSFGGTSPLGNKVKIDPASGVITGIAPEDGIYVVTVCVEEIRDGEVIAVQRKDLQINISSCTIASASIPDEYMLCGDTRSIAVTNFSSSPLITSYNWDFINEEGRVIYTSDGRTASYTFPKEGNYKIKLVVNRNGMCSDSSTSMVRVFPGFVPDFDFRGHCFEKPTLFTDLSTTVFGRVDSWNWDFGENSSEVNTDRIEEHAYRSVGPKSVRLIVSNSVGCIDTVTKRVDIIDKPPITLAFRDTLICLPDELELLASGQGIFNWSPGIAISHNNTNAPIVNPTVTTKYYVDLDDDGCLNRDSVTVRVVDHVTLQSMADTLICSGDAVQLRVVTNGLRFSWTPAAQLNAADVADPVAFTPVSTEYEITSSIGTCSATDNVLVTTVPYPLANAGNDTLICYNTPARLNGSTDGSSFLWLPSGAVTGEHVLDPLVKPPTSAAYILAAYDTRGCPKPGYDTVFVNVLPEMNAFAGNDTSIVVGQPLQLHAIGGIRYSWSPSAGISDGGIADPVLVKQAPDAGIRYKVLVYNEAACVDSAFITVKVFNTLPSIFVPNAFTPNGDGRNDNLRFVSAGIKQIDYFQVYNRYGQLVYRSTSDGPGWNGTLEGKVQPSGTFVWMVKALDYTGAVYTKKGMVVLIR